MAFSKNKTLQNIKTLTAHILWSSSPTQPGWRSRRSGNRMWSAQSRKRGNQICLTRRNRTTKLEMENRTRHPTNTINPQCENDLLLISIISKIWRGDHYSEGWNTKQKFPMGRQIISNHQQYWRSLLGVTDDTLLQTFGFCVKGTVWPKSQLWF